MSEVMHEGEVYSHTPALSARSDHRHRLDLDQHLRKNEALHLDKRTRRAAIRKEFADDAIVLRHQSWLTIGDERRHFDDVGDGRAGLRKDLLHVAKRLSRLRTD